MIDINAYDITTQELIELSQVYEISGLPEMVAALREAFKNPETQKKLFDEYIEPKHSFAQSFCISSSYFIMLKFPGRFKLMRGQLRKQLHWWLEHCSVKEPLLDITHDQFRAPFNYRTGTREHKIEQDTNWTKNLYKQALALGKCAGYR